MLTTIHGTEGSVTFDLAVSLEWTLSDLRRHGEARIVIPRHSVGWSDAVISDEGGFFIEIPTRYGLWRGVADVPVFTPEGATLVVRNITHWPAIRLVGRRKFYGLTAGAIARQAVRQGVIGAVPLTLGTFLEAPPILPEYEFNGQSVLDIFTDLSEQTSQTWEIDDDGRISWVARQGRYKEFWVIDDGRLLEQIQTKTLGEQYAEVIEVESNGRRFSSYKPHPILWPQQREESVGG